MYSTLLETCIILSKPKTMEHDFKFLRLILAGVRLMDPLHIMDPLQKHKKMILKAHFFLKKSSGELHLRS